MHASLLYIGVVAQYYWNCSEPDERGLSYIPSIGKDLAGSNMLTSVALSITDGRPINLFRVQTLDTNCAGEVTAIEYCY